MTLAIKTTPAVRMILPALLTGAMLLVIAFMALRPETPGAGWRAPWAIDPAVWIALAVGVGACLISGGVWALRPADPAVLLFAVSGLATLAFCAGAAAGYLPIPLTPDQAILAATINAIGASAFGIAMICLFLNYPAKLPGNRILTRLTVAGFGIWTLSFTIWPWRAFGIIQLVTFTEMLLIVALVVLQVWATRKDPAARAIAIWLGASVVTGSGFFIATVAAPITFGFAPLIPAIYAFPSFLLIYAGLAVGLLRYRVFGLGAWAFQVFFHLGALLAILIADAAFIGLLSLDTGMAFSASLVLAAVFYLPLRSLAWRRLMREQDPGAPDVFAAVIDTALAPSPGQRASHWEALLRRLYRPLEIAPLDSAVPEPVVLEDGLVLLIPAVAEAPALRLGYRSEGRALFGPADLALAGRMVDLVRYAEASRGAYDRGVLEERARIARDIHDNIGAQLLRALHSPEATRKDAMIRETLTDIRDVINNAEGFQAPLEDVLADLRAETADRLEPLGIELHWSLRASPGVHPDRGKVQALRAMIREAVSNAIKHSGAKQLVVSIEVDAGGLVLKVEDDGCGLKGGAAANGGRGLANIRDRVGHLGGEITLGGDSAGTLLLVTIPVSPAEAAQGTARLS
ncbi:sensor histidine kinase [Hyphomonas sp.]|uniref:sensor histidine kinase n=1 Tax=Hyphomonas sp. TaxID=87 RepID=UPI00391CD7B6